MYIYIYVQISGFLFCLPITGRASEMGSKTGRVGGLGSGIEKECFRFAANLDHMLDLGVLQFWECSVFSLWLFIFNLFLYMVLHRLFSDF